MASESLNLKTLYEHKVDQELSQSTITIIDTEHSGYYTLEFVRGELVSIYIILIHVDNKILIIVIEANNDEESEESESNINLYGFIFESDFSFDFNDLLSRLYAISKYKNQAKIPIHHSYVYLVTEEEILESELDQLLNNPNNNLKISGIDDGGYIINGLDFLVFRPILLPDIHKKSIIVQVYNKDFEFSLDTGDRKSDHITYFPFMIKTSLSVGEQPGVIGVDDSLKYKLSDDTALKDLLAEADQLIQTAEVAETAATETVEAFLAASV
tara:strand:+ start:132 stop:941 length:810 start_codon:yes stop_codon:yes gene_type:complete